MLSVSKGEILFEPIELLINLVIRFFTKTVLQTSPSEPFNQWGLHQWPWIAALLFLLLFVAWAIRRNAKKKSTTAPNP
jgi:hypothetical protein